MSASLGLTFDRAEALWLLPLLVVFAIIGIASYRRHTYSRRIVWLRLGAVLCLILALAGPVLASGSSQGAAVFVVDRSKSLDDASSAAVSRWVNDALDSAGNGERAAVVSFGAVPEVTAPLQSASSFQISNDPLEAALADATNIESALTIARALPVDGDKRIVLISDGSETDGEALGQASEAVTDQTPIDSLFVPGIGINDFRVESVAAPSTIWSGETATVVLTLASENDETAIATVFVDGTMELTETLEIASGQSSHRFPISALPDGFHSIEIRVVPESASDAFLENNAVTIPVVVRSSPEVLLVSPARTDASFVGTSLEERGAAVTHVATDQLPERLSDLVGIDVVVLNNVPARDLTVGQVSALEAITRELGKGLVVIGGTSAYGPGGYSGTALEDLLPVTVRVTEGKERQRVALMLVVDKSGSMGLNQLQDSSKIEMAKEAARLAVGALQDGDEFGLLVFNDKQEVAVDVTPLSGPEARDTINARINMISSDGGTQIYPALRVAFDEVQRSDADVKHIVLLSDGKSDTGTRESYALLIDELNQSSTTLSTIAIGDDADTDLLQYLAEEGFGNYYHAETPDEIPLWTLTEARGAGSQSVIRGGFQLLQVAPSPILNGFELESIPEIRGYAFAEAKDDAQVILTSTRDDPVLAKWQLGLGRVVSWMSDDGIDLAQGWRTWDLYDTFWESVIRWVLPDPEAGPVDVGVRRDGSDSVVSIAASGVDNDYVDLSTANVRVTDQNGAEIESGALVQTSSGTYQKRISDPAPGAYKLELTYDSEFETRTVIDGFTVPESPEFRPTAGSADLLPSISQRSGGRVLSIDDPAAVFDAPFDSGDRATAYRELWWIPVVLALLLFLVEIAERTGFSNQALADVRRRFRSVPPDPF